MKRSTLGLLVTILFGVGGTLFAGPSAHAGDPPAPPAPIPARTDVDDETTVLDQRVRQLVTYDARTGHERRRWETRAAEPAHRTSVPGLGDPTVLGGRADDFARSFPGLARDFTELAFVDDPTAPGYVNHVKIESTYIDENGQTERFSCSGTLIDPKHVLTAGHCIFVDEDEDGDAIASFPFASLVHVGYFNGETGPWGPVSGISYFSWSEWIDDGDLDYDVGVIELDRPIGGIVGWRDYGTSSDCDFFENGNWTRIGFPGEYFSGNFMWEQTGDFDDCDTNAFGWYGNNLQSDQFVQKGQSGSGAVRGTTVYSVASHRDFLGTSHDTRIWPEAFDDITTFIDLNTPNERDLHALDMEVEFESALAGESMGATSFLVHNYSEAEGSVFVSYTVHLSTDSQITSGDTYVTSGNFTHDFARNESFRVSVPNAIVPPELQNGTYFLGAILTISDANAANNTTGASDVTPFTVECATQGVPVPAFPQDGNPCVPTDVTVNWGSVPGLGVSYDLQWWSSSGITHNVATTATQVLLEGLTPGRTHLWRVRATTACGSFSEWSPIFSFETAGTLGDVPILYPAPEQECVATTVTLRWAGVPGASLYRVRFAEDGEPGDEIITAMTSLTMTDLTPVRRYVWSVTPGDACGNYADPGPLVRFVTATDASPDTPVLARPVQGEPTTALTQLVVATERYAIEWEWELQTLVGDPVDAATEPFATEFTVGPLVGGEYRWRARYRQCGAVASQWSPWAAWETFRVDDRAPGFAQPPVAVFPPVGTWTGQELATVEVLPATDDWAVTEYRIAWDQEPDTIPDGTIVGIDAGVWEGILTEGENWFHVVAVDAAGNVSAPQHVGPFYADLSPPPVPSVSANVDPDVPTAVDDLVVSWTAADDSLTSTIGYSVLWSTDENAVVDATVDTTDPTSAIEGTQEGTLYFFVRAVDAVGNASDSSVTAFTIDRTPPHFRWADLPNDRDRISSGDVFEVDYRVDDVSPRYRMTFQHAYSLDDGASWYDIDCGWVSPEETGTCNDRPFAWLVPWAPPGNVMVYRLRAIDEAGNAAEVIGGSFSIDVATGIDGPPSIDAFALMGNAPNPFNPRTTIRYAIPRSAHVRLQVFDVKGTLVRTLVAQEQEGPGTHEVIWNGLDDRGRQASSGVYVYRLQAEDFVDAGRMLLLK